MSVRSSAAGGSSLAGTVTTSLFLASGAAAAKATNRHVRRVVGFIVMWGGVGSGSGLKVKLLSASAREGKLFRGLSFGYSWGQCLGDE